MANRDAHQLGPLLDRSRAGDVPAWNALLSHLRPYLKALICSWLGHDLAGQLVESDVVQETLLRIHRGFEDFRGQGVPELIGWVRRIAYRVALNRRQQRTVAHADPDRLHEVPARDLPPLDYIDKAEQIVRLLAALERLPETRREVVRARLLDGLSYDEISQRSGTSRGALRVLFKRALAQLRQLMEDEA
jgi:RNA polymerase sigma-70 factor (ECF subfamily)